MPKEDDSNKTKRKIFGFVILFICFIIILAIAASQSVRLNTTEKNLELVMEAKREVDYNFITLQTKVTDLSGALVGAKAMVELSKTELESIKKRVENIKTLDDLLGRDIKLYIKGHYRKVPMSVAKNISEHIIKCSKTYNIPPILLVGIIQVESGFNPMITGPKTKYGHARGLMQVMPEWVKKMDLHSLYDLYDIDKNIATGCKVFNIHLAEGKGKISEGLYRYVNKDRKYVIDVYTAMGKFVAFRSTVETGKEDQYSVANGNGKETDGSDKGATNGSTGDTKTIKK